MKRTSRYEAQRFPALIVKAAADHARCSGEALCLQVAQKGMNALGPRPGLAVNNITDPGNDRTSAAS